MKADKPELNSCQGIDGSWVEKVVIIIIISV